MIMLQTAVLTRAVLPAFLALLGLASPGSILAAQPASFVTPHDTIPNFAQFPTIRSVRSGSWSDGNTWTPARLPGASDVVLVRHTVLYDHTAGIAATIGIKAGGVLRFATDRSTALRVGTLLVMPGGALRIGTVQDPIRPDATARVIIRNLPLDTTLDPDQYSAGILAVDGRVVMHGAAKSPTFVRLARTPRAGDTTLSLQAAVTGWQVGDTLVLPDSTQQPTESASGVPRDVNSETVTVQSLSADGRTVTFAPALAFDHPGARDGEGRVTFRPHVANITRNVLVRSESRTGTRGHVLLTHRSKIDIRYSAFRDLGRTTIDPLDPDEQPRRALPGAHPPR